MIDYTYTLTFYGEELQKIEELIQNGYLKREICKIEDIEFKYDTADFLYQLNTASSLKTCSLLDECLAYHSAPFVKLPIELETYEEFEDYCKKNPTTIYFIPQDRKKIFTQFLCLLSINFRDYIDELNVDFDRILHYIELWRKKRKNNWKFNNLTPGNNEELQKYSISEIMEYAKGNDIEIIEHAKVDFDKVRLLWSKIRDISLAESYYIIENSFEEIANTKSWTSDGKIKIYIQDKKKLYKSFVYEIVKDLETNIAFTERRGISEIPAIEALNAGHILWAKDLIYKFNSFYEEWENKYVLQTSKINFTKSDRIEEKNKTKFYFDRITNNNIHNLYEGYSELKKFCTIHEFGLMFENADFIKLLKPNGDAPSIVCFAIYYFQTYLYKGADRKEWFKKACNSINKNENTVKTKANRSKYWKNIDINNF